LIPDLRLGDFLYLISGDDLSAAYQLAGRGGNPARLRIFSRRLAAIGS